MYWEIENIFRKHKLYKLIATVVDVSKLEVESFLHVVNCYWIVRPSVGHSHGEIFG